MMLEEEARKLPPGRRSRLSFTSSSRRATRRRRFPGKPLADLGGKPMVVRVCERARGAGAASVHRRHRRRAHRRRGARARPPGAHDARRPCVGHRPDRRGGRSARASRTREIVVNVQGDEPLIAPRAHQPGGRTAREQEGGERVHRLPRDPRRGLARQPERGQGGARRRGLRALFLALADSVSARARRASATGMPASTATGSASCRDISRLKPSPAGKGRSAGAAARAVARLPHRGRGQRSRDPAGRGHAAGPRSGA